MFVLFLFLLICFFSKNSFSQNPDFLSFKSWGVENGKPLGTIRAIEEDDFGFLWVSFGEDLYRFDGMDFYPVKYLVKEGKAPLHSYYSKLFKDSEGDIWANSYEEGFFIFSPRTETVRNFRPNPKDSIPMPDVRSKNFYETSNGQFWIGIHKEGFGLFNKEKGHFEKIVKPSNYFQNLVDNRWVNESLCFHYAAPYLWVGTVRGLLRYHLENDELEYFPPCLPDNTENPELLNGRESGIRQIFEANDGNFWLSTWGAGLCKFNRETGKCKLFRTATENLTVVESPLFIPKSEKELWISMNGGKGFGVFNLEKETFHFYNRKNLNCEISEGKIYSMFEDSKGKLWLANKEKLWVNDSRRLLTPINSLHTQNLNIVEFLNRKELFFTLPSNQQFGIQNIETGIIKTYQYFPKKLASPQQRIKGVLQMPNGEILFHETRGIYKWDENLKKATTWLSLPDSILDIASEGIRSSLIDKKGFLWLGMRTKGLVRVNLKTKALTLFQNKNEKAAYPIAYNGYIEELFEDSQGRIWHGTERGFGYFDYEKNDFTNFPFGTYQTDNEEIILKQVVAFAEDAQGRIWVGSNRKGLGYLEIGGDSVFIKTFSTKDGLRNDGIYQMLTDKNGDIWMLTGSGISKLNTQNLTFENFGSEFGITNQYKMSLTENGEIILPNPFGYWKFLPDEVQSISTTPESKLLTFNVFDKPFERDTNLNSLEKVELDYTQNFFSFEFGSINYFNPEFTEFAYRLKGLEENWNTIKDRRYASYTNIGHGEYSFEVKARSENGEWGPVKKLDIDIIPPYWKRDWFILLIVGIFIDIGIVAYLLHIKRIEEKEKLQTEFNKKLAEVEMTALRAQMNPHFLFNCLNSIKLFIVKNESEIAAEYLTKFSRLIRQILQNSQNHLVTLSNELDALQLYIEMEKMRFRNQFDYSVKIEEGIQPEQFKIPPLILQPYVENAIWHGLIHEDKPNQLSIQIFKKDEILKCVIEDNGIGRLAAKARRAHQNARKKSMGMSITQDRISLTNQLYNIQTTVEVIDLEDENGEALGTRVEVSIPVRLTN